MKPEVDATAAEIVAALEAQGLVTAADRERAYSVIAGLHESVALAEPAAPAAPAAALPRLVEVVAYVGAALVLAAGGLFLATAWGDLGAAGQVTALAVVAAVLAGAGLVARGDASTVRTHEVRRRLAGTLLGGSAVAAGFTVAVALDRAHDGSWDLYLPAVVGGLVASGLGIVGYRLSPSAAGLLAILGGLLVAAPTSATNAQHDESLWVGGCFFVIGVLWLIATEAGFFAERTVARSLGCSTIVFGAQFIALVSDRHALGYVLTAGVVVAAVLLYLAQLAWPYLTAAVIGITFVVPEAVSDWTGGGLDVITGVMLTGVTLLLASFAGYRLSTEARD